MRFLMGGQQLVLGRLVAKTGLGAGPPSYYSKCK